MEPESDSFDISLFPRIVWIERDEFTRSVDRAMLEFLRAIKRIAPEVLSTLATDLLPLYQSLFLSCTAFERRKLLEGFTNDVAYGVTMMGRMPIASMPDELIIERSDSGGSFNLRMAVWRWAKHLNLDGWVLNMAMETLKGWNLYGTPEDLDWEYRVDRPVKIDPRLGFRFEYIQWLPDADTWSSYEKKLDKALSRAKREYKRKMLLISKDTKKGKTVGKYKLEHFEWLVYFQIKEKDYEEIYEMYKTACNVGSVKAVSKAVKESATLIDLPLRKTGRKPGRPQKH